MERVVGSGVTPKYALVERAIFDAINEGHYAPGAQLPGERALAQTMGVAPMTLRQGVNRLVDQGVLERRGRVGTFVRKAGATGNIGLLMFHVRRMDSSTALPACVLDILHTCIMDALREASGGRSSQVRAMLMFEPYPSAAQLCSELRAMGVGAVGLLGFLEDERDFIRQLSEMIPCVMFVKGLPGVAVPTTKIDMTLAANGMVDCFAARGRRRLAAGAFTVHHPMHAELTYAIEAAAARHGMAIDRRLWLEPSDRLNSLEEATNEWIDSLLDAPSRPDALVLSTMTASEYLRARLAERGERIGEDMDVIALHSGERPDTARMEYPIMFLNNTDSYRAGAELLLKAVDGKPGAGGAPVLSFPPELILPQAWETSGDAVLAAGERRCD